MGHSHTIVAACDRLAALSDPIRLRLLTLLLRHGELCVCEFTHALMLPQPKVSKHLAVLREADLVRIRRDAQWVLYSLAPEAAEWLASVLSATLRALENDPDIARDAERLAGMTGRPQRSRVA